MAALSRKRLLARTKRKLRHMSPAHLVRTRATATTMKAFADTIGMVYFGTIHQGDEEMRLIRGHTVSPTHIDNHYAVGSLRGYDIAMVQRNDVVLSAHDHKEQRCHWLIITIDLHAKSELPHVYVGHRNRDSVFRSSFEQLKPLYIGALGRYSARFLDQYTVYGKATHMIAIEQTITPQIAEVIATHFDHVSFEIEDNTVYLYIESQRPTAEQLEKMLSNGLWLVEMIDRHDASLYCEVPKKEP